MNAAYKTFSSKIIKLFILRASQIGFPLIYTVCHYKIILFKS